jgi:integrase
MDYFRDCVAILYAERFPAIYKQLETGASLKIPPLVHDLQSCILALHPAKLHEKPNAPEKFKDWILARFRQQTQRVNFVQSLAKLNVHADFVQGAESLGLQNDERVQRLYQQHCSCFPRAKRIKMASFLSFLENLMDFTDAPLENCGRVSFYQALAFCTKHSTSNHAKTALLRIAGYTATPMQDLEQAVETRLTACTARFAQHMQTEAKKYNVSVYFRLLDALQVVEYQGLVAMSDQAILRALEQINKDCHISFRLACKDLDELGRPTGALSSSLPYRFTKKTQFQLLQARSSWMRTLLADVLVQYSSKSNFKDVRARQLKTTIPAYIRFVEGYTGKDFRAFTELPEVDLEKLCVAYIVSRKMQPGRVKSSLAMHSGQNAAFDMLMFLQKGLKNYLVVPDTLTIKTLLALVENVREPADSQAKRAFTDEEVDRMLAVNAFHPRNTLIITILREIGLRVQAICSLKYYMLVAEDHQPRHLCRVPEKANTIRDFITGPNLKQKIKLYVDSLEFIPDADFYLLNPAGKEPLHASTIDYMLKVTARAAKVTTPMHAHAFRHTIVGKLLCVGNSIDVVSKFMGHKSIKTTERYYFVSTMEELNKNMNNPFTQTFHHKRDREDEMEIELELMRLKKQKTLQIIRMYNNIITTCIKNNQPAEEVQTRIFQEMPDLGQKLKMLSHDGEEEETTI